jgi:hypothetical protein
MKRKVVIKGLPKNQSGAEVKMSSLRAGLGLNANVMPWPIMAGKMSEPDLKVNSTLQPVPREQANLEAEKDEVAMVPGQGNIPDTFTIGGKRHTQGGTPLNLPADSFIYSDTAKMRIKDPVILAQFGMPARKNGYTPAEIAKKYSTAPYKKILADHNVDPKQRETAELMLANYNLKLAKLALVQESMKGFPQGIPEVARPYIESMQINPEEFMQQNPGSPSNSEDSESQEGAMEIGGPVMQQQPGSPLQYLEEGGPDYFAMGGLKRYQTAGVVKEEPNRYKDILDNDYRNNPYDFRNIEYAIRKKNKSIKYDDESDVGKIAVEKLDKNIALINSYKKTQPEVYKNLLPTLDRLIKSKQQFAEYGNYWDNKDLAKKFGDPYVHPDIQAASDAYPITPKDPNALDLSNLPGFNSWHIPGYDTESNAAAFSADPETKDAMALYMKGLQANDVPTLESYAQSLSNYNVPNSWAIAPWSKQNKISDLAQILRERATKIKNKDTGPDQTVIKKGYKDKANTILGVVYNKYRNAPEGSQAKLDAKAEYDDVVNNLPHFTEPKHPLDSQQNLTGWYGDKIKSTIDKYAQKYLAKPAAKTTEESPTVNTNVLQAGAPSGTVQPAGAAPTQSMSLEAYKKMKGYKEYGGPTSKKVRITNLPGMAYGGGLNKYEFAGENPYDPLNLFNQKLKMNTAQAAPQAQVVDYSLNAGIPADSPLNKQAMQLDFSSSKPVESNTALEAKQATEASETNRPYKKGRITQKTKTEYGAKEKYAVQESAKASATNLANSVNTPYLKEQAHIKSTSDYAFTPIGGGNKGTWVESGMAYGLIDPNSPIVQQSGVAKYGGSMNEYKLGGYTTVNGQGGAYDDGLWLPMSRADYDLTLAQEKAASVSKTQPTTGAPKKAATAPASSTIGVYNKEWTKYLTDLAKSSGMSIDDPRFRAKLPSYFFDEKTGKFKSKAELDQLSKTTAVQKQLGSGAFGEEYWNDQYQPDFAKRHKNLIAQFEKEHPGEKFNPTNLDMATVNGKPTESSHMKWFQEAYNKQAKEKGAPQYDFGKANKFGRLSYSVPSLDDAEVPATKEPEVTADAGPGITAVDNKTTDPLKVTHLDQKPISTPKYGWTARDMLNVTGAVGELMRTKKYMPWEATPGYHAADFVFDDPSRRIAAINETRNIAAQNMAGLTNSQAYAANFLAMNNLGDVANAISDVHSRNIGTANQKAMADAQYLNQVGQDRAAQQTRLWDKNQAVNQAYDAEQAAKRDVVRNMVGQGMSNASKIYNLNQLQPQFAINPFSETMYHKDPRSLKPKYAEKKDLAKEYQDVLTNNKNLNATPEGRKMAFDIAKYNVGAGPVTEEDAYMEYQKKRNASQIPQYGDNTEQQ